jgi:hypothetical protein
MFIVTGLLTIVASLAAYLYPRVRLVEDELPDVVVETIQPAADAPVGRTGDELESLAVPAG